MSAEAALATVEIALLVGALAGFPVVLGRLLVPTGVALATVADDLVAVRGHCATVGEVAEELNRRLRRASGQLEQAAAAVEELAHR